MSDEKKPPNGPPGGFAEFMKGFDLDYMKGFTPPIAAAAFSTPSPQHMNFPTMEERFGFASAETVIGDLLSRIRKTQVKEPEKGELAVMMLTPDGRIMDVESLWPEGFATFRAEGYVNGMPCFVLGHISTLNLFCAFGERKDKARVGFRTDTQAAKPPAEEAQPEVGQNEAEADKS